VADAIPPRAVSAAAGPPKPADLVEVRAREFEAVLLSALLKPVFQTLAEDASFGGGAGESAWSDLLVDEYAGAIADAGGIGLTEAVRRELIALQENAG
jgi:Rod binding domain-containing protein